MKNLTKKQRLIFDEFANNSFLRTNLYFTGGTALSAVYLQHRLSEDLDFFSEKEFDIQTITDIITKWSRKLAFAFERREIGNAHIHQFQFEDGENLKVDFALYPYELLEKGKVVKGVSIDSLLDIATNKLLTISQRTQVKDFVDLYFLLKKYTIWDLIDGAKVKFRLKTEPLLVAYDFLKVESFENLPEMLKPLTLEELKMFFREKAKQLGKMATE